MLDSWKNKWIGFIDKQYQKYHPEPELSIEELKRKVKQDYYDHFPNNQIVLTAQEFEELEKDLVGSFQITDTTDINLIRYQGGIQKCIEHIRWKYADQKSGTTRHPKYLRPPNRS